MICSFFFFCHGVSVACHKRMEFICKNTILYIPNDIEQIVCNQHHFLICTNATLNEKDFIFFYLFIFGFFFFCDFAMGSPVRREVLPLAFRKARCTERVSVSDGLGFVLPRRRCHPEVLPWRGPHPHHTHLSVQVAQAVLFLPVVGIGSAHTSCVARWEDV